MDNLKKLLYCHITTAKQSSNIKQKLVIVQLIKLKFFLTRYLELHILQNKTKQNKKLKGCHC